LLKGSVKGEFLYDYDKIRMQGGRAKDRVPSFTELEIYDIENLPANFYSLVYVYGGDANVYIDGEKYIVPENSLIIADRFSVIIPCTRGRRQAYWVALDFKPELFGRIGKDYGDFGEMLKHIMGTFYDYKFDMPKGYILRDRTGRIKERIDISWLEYKNRRMKYVDIIRDNIRAILIELARDLQCFKDNSIEIELIQRIIDYCELHYMDKITLKSLSERFNYSESYITKAFKREMKISFAEWLRQKRIYISAGKIHVDNTKIAEIAKSVGYNDAEYFSECFEKYIGMSPTEYRYQIRKRKSWFIGAENLKRQKDIILTED